jgi:hypothetical protein
MAAIYFIKSLDMIGMKTDLTKFQIVMNLAIYEICELLTLEEIAI